MPKLGMERKDSQHHRFTEAHQEYSMQYSGKGCNHITLYRHTHTHTHTLSYKKKVLYLECQLVCSLLGYYHR
ncbi:hypothetical protein FKM82_000671 [Ascaphus truei]